VKAILGIVIVSVALHSGAKGNTNTIQSAAWSGDLEKVKKYLADTPQLLSSKEGAGTLTAAAEGGQGEMVAFLISQGADVNEKGFEDMTPLASIASTFRLNNDEKCAEIAAILLAHGAQVDPVDAYKDTPLLHAVEAGKSRLAQVFLNHGASLAVTFSGANSRLTPLHYALRHSDQEMVAVIMEFKPPLEAFDTDSNTPLLWAVKHDKLETARMLLEHGASVTPTYTIASSGMTPIQWHFTMVNNHGNTPFHWAIYSGDKEMVALLLKFKAPLDVKNEFGATPLDLAEASGKTEIAGMLRQAAPVNSQRAPGTDPATLPSLESMRAIAQRIADGDDAAFDELATISDNLYRGIDYKNDQWRVGLNFARMHAAFDVLDKEAGKGNDKAFQALKKSLTVRHLSSFAPDALGIVAAAGNKEALDILLHHDQWGIMESLANQALQAPAAANLEPVVDYFAAILLDHANANRGVYGAAKSTLKSAAAKGNLNAQAALEKFNALYPNQF
jgi:ankyrin repeat protein